MTECLPSTSGWCGVKGGVSCRPIVCGASWKVKLNRKMNHFRTRPVWECKAYQLRKHCYSNNFIWDFFPPSKTDSQTSEYCGNSDYSHDWIFKSQTLGYKHSLLSSKVSQCLSTSIMHSVGVQLNASQLAFRTLKVKQAVFLLLLLLFLTFCVLIFFLTQSRINVLVFIEAQKQSKQYENIIPYETS